MGCGSSTATAVAPETTKPEGGDEAAPIEPSKAAAYPPAEAFEVPLDDETAANTESGSIIKRHPPKRLLQRLAEAENSSATTTTIEDLQEKLANAELRRNKFLQQRVDRIKEADDTESMDGGNAEEENNNMTAQKKSLTKLIESQGEQQIADEVEPVGLRDESL